MKTAKQHRKQYGYIFLNNKNMTSIPSELKLIPTDDKLIKNEPCSITSLWLFHLKEHRCIKMNKD